MSVMGQREPGVSDTIDFQRFEQVESTHRYRTRIFITCGIGSVTLDWRSNSQGSALGWRCRLSRLISRETGTIRGGEDCKTPALMDELQTHTNANSWQWGIACPCTYSVWKRKWGCKKLTSTLTHHVNLRLQFIGMLLLPVQCMCNESALVCIARVLVCLKRLIKDITVNHVCGRWCPALWSLTIASQLHWIQVQLLDHPDGYGGLGTGLKQGWSIVWRSSVCGTMFEAILSPQKLSQALSSRLIWSEKKKKNNSMCFSLKSFHTHL